MLSIGRDNLQDRGKKAFKISTNSRAHTSESKAGFPQHMSEIVGLSSRISSQMPKGLQQMLKMFNRLNYLGYLPKMLVYQVQMTIQSWIIKGN